MTAQVIYGIDFRAKTRKPADVCLEQMAAEIFSYALTGGPLPTYGFNDTAPSEMPPEAS